MKWTREQEQAIKARGGNLLVSAAAGSGKTAVVTQRAIDIIVNENVDLSRILMITFTEAAAMEMLKASPFIMVIWGRSEAIRKVPSTNRKSGRGIRLFTAMAMASKEACKMLIRSISSGSTMPMPTATA